ncbi:MAG: 3-hydroxyacyl-ACP dehydratase FabZ [Rhizobiaceae bacterium]|nr:3-hydroxyacyl-ACP dehydratase FabZ [Rhizobiaceae bacterium]
MSSDTQELSTLDIQKLLKLLPHRYPFLLVDRIIEVDGDDSAIGIKNVTMNEPHFTGHFPDMPVMPGVLIIEAMAQTAGAICVNAMEGVSGPPMVFFMTIDGAKFRKPVVPGDQLEIHVRKLKQRGGVFRFGCEGRVGGVKVAEAEVSAMVSFENGR